MNKIAGEEKSLCQKQDDQPAAPDSPEPASIESQKEFESDLLAVQQRITLLNEISKAILFDMSVMDVISYTLSKLHLFSPYYRFVYSIIDRDSRLTVLHGIEPSGMVSLKGKKIDMSPARAFTKSLQHFQVIVCEDVSRDSRFAPIMAEMISGNIKATLVVPLSHSNKLVGMICMDASKCHRWSVHEITALQEVAQYLSIAIKNAHLQEKRRRDAERLGKWTHVFENAKWGIAVHDPEKTGIEMMNPAYARMHGYTMEELSNKSIADLFAPDSRGSLSGWLDKVNRTGHLTFESTHIRKDGSTFPALTDATAVREETERTRYMVMNTLDITEQKHVETEKKTLEDQLRQAQKMEAIGTLAGGIAHDFNNILSAILGHTDIVMEILPKDNPLRGHVRNVLNAGERAKDLVKQILTFSRQAEQEYIPLKVHLIVKEAMKLLRASIPATIKIKQDLDPDCSAVMADPTQIHQIVMNLCTNAYHAMRETGGTLTVSLGQCHESNEKALLTPKSFLKLVISDTGRGIPGGDMEKIFEPYFTTKGKGEGTGLGLAIVHGIVGKMNGTIRVQSEENRGTAFQIFLPMIDVKNDGLLNADILPIATGSERILVVDDEDVLVDMNKTILESIGYRITGLSDSTDAFNLFRNDPDAFDLLLTDMTMPGLTGVALARQFFSIRPEIPVVLCTGYSDQIDADMARAIGIHGFVKKPAIKSELARAVREALDYNLTSLPNSMSLT